MSTPRLKRLSWIANQLSEGMSNAEIVLQCVKLFPGVSEKVARKDLKETLQHMTEIELENLPEIKTRFMEIGWKLLEECRELAQMGPAVTQFKNLATIAGIMTEKLQVQSEAPTGTPEAKLVRERIAQLMKDRKIREDAQAAGIDLDKLHSED